jgi:hypothetical protein
VFASVDEVGGVTLPETASPKAVLAALAPKRRDKQDFRKPLDQRLAMGSQHPVFPTLWALQGGEHQEDFTTLDPIVQWRVAVDAGFACSLSMARWQPSHSSPCCSVMNVSPISPQRWQIMETLFREDRGGRVLAS